MNGSDWLQMIFMIIYIVYTISGIRWRLLAIKSACTMDILHLHWDVVYYQMTVVCIKSANFTVRKRSIWVKIGRFFVTCDLQIWRMTLKNNWKHLPCSFTLCESFHSHRWIQTGVTVRKRLIWVKVVNILSPVTLKLGRWPWKTTGHISYATSDFVHHIS